MQFHCRTCLPVALIALGCCVVFAPLLNPASTPAGMDFLNLLYPQAQWTAAALRAGELPLWNWRTWGGSPLLAAMQSAPLYPPMWLTVLLPLPYALQLNIVAHLAFGGIGAAALSRKHFRVGEWFAAYAGIAYACSAYFLGRIDQVNCIAAMMYAPWIFGAVFDILQGDRGFLRLLCLASLCFLAGHPQDLVLIGLFAQLAVVFALGGAIRAGTLRLAAIRVAAVELGFAGAALICAGQFLPTWELSRLSERIWPYPDPNPPALKWSYLPALVVPRFYNTLSGNPGQAVEFAEVGLYAGILTLPLFVIGLVACGKRNLRACLAGGAIWLLAFNYALGESSIVTRIVFKLIPFLQHSRGAARALNVETLFYAVFAGAGLRQVAVWLLRDLTRLSAYRFAAAAAVLLIMDLAVVHGREARSLTVTTDVLRVHPGLDPSDKWGRLYRFMANDSDFYLDRSIRAVAERMRRLQPNLALNDEMLLDGYEEGLIPPRHYANFLRLYNRNLRNDKVDAALLALIGCNRMITEYPLQNPGPEWKLAHAAEGARGRYTVWQSRFETAPVVPAALFRNEAGAVSLASTLQETRAQPGNVPIPHPLTGCTPEEFNEAVHGIAVVQRETNSLRITLPDASQEEYVFAQSSYPGWKAVSGAERHPVKLRSAVTSVFTPHSADVQLIFDPFSFRLGLFLSLLSVCSLTVCIIVGPVLRKSLNHNLTGKAGYRRK